jgi:hypothetical protein
MSVRKIEESKFFIINKNMNEQELERFGEQIKRQGENQGGTMTQLVYNPDTGEFEQVAKGSAHVGDVVTEMTEKGFA